MQISRNAANGLKSNNHVLVGIRAIVCVTSSPLFSDAPSTTHV